MNLKLLFIFVCVLISFVLFGCKHEKIKFYRESGVQQLMQNTKNGTGTSGSNATTTRSSGGIIIYKDNSVNDTTGGSANFGPIGPKDIDFNLKIK